MVLFRRFGQKSILVERLVIALGVVCLLSTVVFSEGSFGTECGECLGGDTWEAFEDVVGGAECQHGPENCDDTSDMYVPVYDENNFLVSLDQPMGYQCCETAAGQTRFIWDDLNSDGAFEPGELTTTVVPDCTSDFACRCFDCLPELGCEPIYYFRIPHCGTVDEPGGDCPVGYEDPTVVDYPLQKAVPALPPADGEPCGGSNSEPASGDPNTVTFYLCGAEGFSPTETVGGSGGIGTTCLAPNCLPDPAAAEIIEPEWLGSPLHCGPSNVPF